MTNPRVLMLPKWYPHRYDDQEGDFVARHVAAIAPHAQVAVVFATVARGPLPTLIVCEADHSTGFPTWRYYYRARPIGFAPLDKPLKLLLYYWCAGQGYRQALRHWGAPPQLTHVHVLLRTGLLAWWWRLRYGIPYLLTEHWTLYLPARARQLSWVRRWLTRRVVAGTAALHTVSDNLRQAMRTLGMYNQQTVVIPNVVDTALFHPATAVDPNRSLLHVAAFNEAAKNLTGILRVVQRLRLERPTLTLRIAGYGPDEAAVRQAAAKLGLLDGAVQFLGKLPPAAVAQEMRQAAALVLFSNYENLPCVLVEAQASGLPAVATRVGGVPELLPPDGRYGRLLPPGDEDALTEALRAILQPTTAFDTDSMRAHAVARFSYMAVGQQFADLYNELLGLTPPTP
ncbi:glycosyltransferase [Hymenobacter sp. BT507]|uniref:Glycosyltransferase n=1 Tax=Hymenobacter citatus TaxID=2763506 RepID=A0ABR7MLZ7_9BACT|nr:glycosyltransferase [Hymenobacter citatus]MBC6611939.1 glycosyltransferase [Hymenobacter citatus]